MRALRIRERELLLLCSVDEFLCRQPNRFQLALSKFLRVEQDTAPDTPGKLLQPSHCHSRRIPHWFGKCVHAVLNVWTMMTEVPCFTNTRLEDSCFVWCE